MIKTFIIDAPVCLLIGLIYAYTVKDQTKSVFKTKGFASAIIVTTIFVLLAYYSTLIAPDWMWMYYLDSRNIPGWMILYAFLLYYVPVIAGFLLKFELDKINKKLSFVALIIAGLSELIVWALTAKRYFTVATFEEFHKGHGVPLLKTMAFSPDSLALILNCAFPVMIVIAIVLFIISLKSQKVTS